MPQPRFLIYCPIGVKTGGPECLYQLCDAINELGYQSLIVPSIDTSHLSPCPDFEKYNVTYLRNRKIHPQDVLIIPEVSNRIPKWLSKSISPANLVVWWLSVDNSPKVPFNKYEQRNYQIHSRWMPEELSQNKPSNPVSVQSFLHFFSQLKTLVFKIRLKMMTSEVDLELCNHFAQSEYAQKVVSKTLVKKVGMLTDYVYGAEFQKMPVAKTARAKKRVAYNPFKGSELMRTFVSLFEGEVTFVELRNMNTEQVAKTLQDSDLYLDLGHFPGKDRIPREAILVGCPVFLANRGAARNNKDFNLHADFKVDLANTTPQELKSRIVNHLVNGELLQNQLEFFVQQTDSKQVFLSQAREFVKSFSQVNSEDRK